MLTASPSNYSDEGSRKTLGDVQRSTKSEKARFENYSSAQEVKRMFEEDLNSEPAKKVQSELRKLRLPTLPDLEEKFEQICAEEWIK